MTMIPHGNNVYGQVIAPEGLQPVLRAVERLIGENRVYIKKSQFSGAETLHFGTDDTQFDSTPLEEAGHHLVNGAVGGSLEDVVGFVRALSGSLPQEGIEHHFEVYDGERLVQTFPE